MHKFLMLTAQDAMTREVRTVSPDTKVRELGALFQKYDYNSFPVLDRGAMVGIVTKLDYLKNFIFTPQSIVPNYQSLLERTVAQVMSSGVVSVSPETPLSRILELMVETRRRSFPVVDQAGKLVGIISREDILKKLG